MPRNRQKKEIIVPISYAGKWVAWSSDNKRIVGSGDTVHAARMEAKKAGEDQPWLDKIPDKDVRFGGAAFRT